MASLAEPTAFSILPLALSIMPSFLSFWSPVKSPAVSLTEPPICFVEPETLFSSAMAKLSCVNESQRTAEMNRSSLQFAASRPPILVESGDTSVADDHVGIAKQSRSIGNRKADIFSRQKWLGSGSQTDPLQRPSGKRSFS